MVLHLNEAFGCLGKAKRGPWQPSSSAASSSAASARPPQDTKSACCLPFPLFQARSRRDDGLQRRSDGKDIGIGAAQPGDHQADGRGACLMAWYRGGTAVEGVDEPRVPQ